MSVVIHKTLRVKEVPTSIIQCNNKLYVCTKSNKVLQVDTMLEHSRSIQYKENIRMIIPDTTHINCITVCNKVYKYSTEDCISKECVSGSKDDITSCTSSMGATTKHTTHPTNSTNHSHKNTTHSTNTTHPTNSTHSTTTTHSTTITYYNHIDNGYIIGTSNGKVMYTHLDLIPYRSFHGCTYKVVYAHVCDGTMIAVDNKIVILNIQTGKLKYHSIGHVSAVDLYNKRILVLSTDNMVYLYDIVLLKVVHTYSIRYVSSIKVVHDKILIGTESRILSVCTIQYNKIVVLYDIVLEGIVNSIYTHDKYIYIGVGTEERHTSMGRNMKYKNMLYKCTLQ